MVVGNVAWWAMARGTRKSRSHAKKIIHPRQMLVNKNIRRILASKNIRRILASKKLRQIFASKNSRQIPANQNMAGHGCNLVPCLAAWRRECCHGPANNPGPNPQQCCHHQGGGQIANQPQQGR